MSNSSSRTAVVRHEQGLHARPAEMLARAAMGFRSAVELEFAGRRVDAKSILNILTLAAEAGSSIVVHASGEDAAPAAESVARLIESDFESDQFPVPIQEEASRDGSSLGGTLGRQTET